MRGLDNRTAIVTGVASRVGLGFAIAQRLASEGANVVVTDIKKADAEARAAEVGRNTLALHHDVTSETSWDQVIAATVERHGPLDILVNNAGIVIAGPLVAYSLEAWHRQIEVNLTSVFLGCRAAVRQFKHQGGGGAIINMSSMAGLVGSPGGVGYSTSKGGIRLLSKTLALELASDNIRVNSVHPGVIDTELQSIARGDVPDQIAKIHGSVPVGRLGEPEDVGAMVAFLASQDAKYITGAEFAVDGGFTAQ